MTGMIGGLQGSDITRVTSAETADDSHVVAVFATNNSAHLARDALVAAGLPGSCVHVIDRADPQAVSETTPDLRRSALLKTIGSLFSRSENTASFHLAEDPLHALVVLDRHAALGNDRVRQILAASGPVEIYTSH